MTRASPPDWRALLEAALKLFQTNAHRCRQIHPPCPCDIWALSAKAALRSPPDGAYDAGWNAAIGHIALRLEQAAVLAMSGHTADVLRAVAREVRITKRPATGEGEEVPMDGCEGPMCRAARAAKPKPKRRRAKRKAGK